MAVIVRQLLPVLLSSTYSKRVFSMCGSVLTKRRAEHH